MTLQRIFDALLELRAPSAAARTATGADAAKEFPLTPVNTWNEDPHAQTVDVVVDITAISLSGATIVIGVEVDTSSGFASPVEVVRLNASAVGRFILPVNMELVDKLEPGATHIRTNCTITGGTTPSIDFNAFIAKY